MKYDKQKAKDIIMNLKVFDTNKDFVNLKILELDEDPTYNYLIKKGFVIKTEEDRWLELGTNKLKTPPIRHQEYWLEPTKGLKKKKSLSIKYHIHNKYEEYKTDIILIISFFALIVEIIK